MAPQFKVTLNVTFNLDFYLSFHFVFGLSFNPFPTNLIFNFFQNTWSTYKNVKNQVYVFLRST